VGKGGAPTASGTRYKGEEGGVMGRGMGGRFIKGGGNSYYAEGRECKGGKDRVGEKRGHQKGGKIKGEGGGRRPLGRGGCWGGSSKLQNEPGAPLPTK